MNRISGSSDFLRRACGNDRGIAIITAIWMTMIGVMLVTTMSSMIQGNVGIGFAITGDAKARAAATAAVHKAIAELIKDRPSVSAGDPGVMITEIRCYAPPRFLNMLTDSSFETWDGNASTWKEITTSSAAVFDYGTTTYEGAKSCQFDAPTGAFSGRGAVSESVSLVAGVNYTYGCFAYRLNTASPGNTTIRIRLEYFTAADAFIESDAIQTTFTAGDQWFRFQDTVTAPAGTTKANVYISVMETAGDYDVYVDKAFLETVAIHLQHDREYVEIQNADSISHNLISEDYWLSVGSDTAGHRRRIYPLSFAAGSDSTLEPGEVGVIVGGPDADTSSIASLSGYTASDIKWFGLKAASGAAFDTLIGNANSRELLDAAETVVIGFGVAATPPTARPFWFGIPVAKTPTTPTGDTSFTKGNISTKDDTSSTFRSLPDTTWANKGPSPGVGLSTTGRSGYDGPGDTWYRLSYDSFVKFDSTSFDIYYRVRVFDEGGKINANAVRLAGSGSDEADLFVHYLQQSPCPPFLTSYSYTAADASGMKDALLAGPLLLNPTAGYLIYQTTNSVGNRDFDKRFIPFITPYGYKEGGVFPININTAETPAIRAALLWALAQADNVTENAYKDSGFTLAQAQTYARDLAERLMIHMTKADTNLSNDTGFSAVADIKKAAINEYDTAALRRAENNGRLARVLGVASTNYFTIYASGFAYQAGGNVLTDTPIAQNRVVCVIRRYVDADKADILYWREIFEIADPSIQVAVFPIGTWRHPKYRFDPNQGY